MPLDVAKIVAPAERALAPLGATLSETWSALIGDKVAAWRLRNAASLQAEIHAELQRQGVRIDRSRIPERYAISWFEEATKQDEPELQTLFARLLVKAASGDQDAADRRHLEMLTRFTPIDTKVFDWFYSVAPNQHPSYPEYSLWKNLRVEFGDASWTSIEHLIATGAIERRFDAVKKERTFIAEEEWTAAAEIAATELGMSLHRACKEGGTPAAKDA